MLPGIGIFGSGFFADILVDYFREKGFKIEAIWSPKAEDAQAASAKHGIPFHSTVVDRVLLLPSVQLIVIATVPHFHSQIASKACGIGKHVLCNWPPANSIKDAGAMLRAATNYPSLITLISTTLRFVPAFSLMRKLIVDDALLGNIRVINASVQCDASKLCQENLVIWDKHMGGGLLSTFGSNLIDIISFTTDMRARRVHGSVNYFGKSTDNAIVSNNADDYVHAIMEMKSADKLNEVSLESEENPVMASITLNGLHSGQYPKHELSVYGTRGYLICRDGILYARFNEPKGKVAAERCIYREDEQIVSPRAQPYSEVYPKLYLYGISSLIDALFHAFKGQKQVNGENLEISEMNGQKAINGNELINNEVCSEPMSEDFPMIHWEKEAVCHAANFKDGVYMQEVIESIKLSSTRREWIRIHSIE